MNDHYKLRQLFGVDERPGAFDQISITVASPQTIRSWSKGEIKNPSTIKYGTSAPENGGLFCQRIFGPTRDWKCACGKFKGIKHNRVICDSCGVEVTHSRVRRERMGHIDLAVPVSHIWYSKYTPSPIGQILNLSERDLERIIYYKDFVVTDPGYTSMVRGQVLTEYELRQAEDIYGEGRFCAKMGAEAIQDLLKQINLAELIASIENELFYTRSRQDKRKLLMRLRICRGFTTSKTRPEWMVQTVLPVIPPGLRPLGIPGGGHLASIDLNELYLRVINVNNRLKNLLLLRTAEVIIRNEKRRLQEAVDALIDNGCLGRAVTSDSNRPLKSLSDMLMGKGGRFRQGMLGKRVDYSGRSVIVVGPDLKLSQCGLPKSMALTLFEPFIIRRLKELGYCHTVRSAKKMIDRRTTEVWDILAEVTRNHPILLSCAPAWHRLSIQSFEPILIEGDAIRINPLVCSAYGADFDGRQMAVHVPLSIEAQMECRLLMVSSKNIFSPTSGRPFTDLASDIIFGIYYMTLASFRSASDRDSGEYLPLFETLSEVDMAIASRKIDNHSWIRIRNPDLRKDTIFGYKGKNLTDKDIKELSLAEQVLYQGKFIETTPGRVRFNEIWPSGIGFINRNVDKHLLDNIIWHCHELAGKSQTIRAIEALKKIGLDKATRAGISIGVGDNISHIGKIYGIPGKTSNLCSKSDRLQSISIFREGLSAHEYFKTTQEVRMRHTDPFLQYSYYEYFTRKLVDVAKNIVITTSNCHTSNCITVGVYYEGEEKFSSFTSRIYGRVSGEQIKDPVSGEIIVDVDDVVNDMQARAIESIGVHKLKIRSVLTCDADRGCCARCYGLNLATGTTARVGDSVGLMAGQAIGEAATRIVKKLNDADYRNISDNLERLLDLFEARETKASAIVSKTNGVVFLGYGRNSSVFVRDWETNEKVAHFIPGGKSIIVTEGDNVKCGDPLTDGPLAPDVFFHTYGPYVFANRFINEVQAIYRANGVEINDKHIELILRQMLQMVIITNSGDLDQYCSGDVVDRSIFRRANAAIIGCGRRPADADHMLLGISKASLEDDSFLSAASVQDTTRVLTDAAILGRTDHLSGFRENVLVGNLIPAGTGFQCHRETEFEFAIEE